MDTLGFALARDESRSVSLALVLGGSGASKPT